MKAMLLAAGRGLRLDPLTQHKPKPLVRVGNKLLIDYALESIVQAGISKCVINLYYKGQMIENYVKTGEKWGIKVEYSREDINLNTGGGVLNALPLLGDDLFLLVNCDLIHSLKMAEFIQCHKNLDALAHLVLYKSHSASEGDFSLDNNLVVPGNDYIFCGISIINPLLFSEIKIGRKSFPLKEIFNLAMAKKRLSGELYMGQWLDLGTMDSLKQANKQRKNY